MATVIRLKRGGRTHAPYYRIVVLDSRTTGKGRVIDQIGVYQPCARPDPVIEVDNQKALDWLAKGAQPSNTVRTVLSKRGITAAGATGAKEQASPAPAPETVAADADAPAQAEGAAQE